MRIADPDGWKQAIAAAKGEIATIEMEASEQPIANVSAALKSGKDAAN